MKAQGPPPAANGHWVELTAPGAEPLPAERCVFRNPHPPFEQSNGYETTWKPDLGEQRALANGANVILRVWGDGHPPVSLGVTDPQPGGRILVDRGLWLNALGRTFAVLADRDGELNTDPAGNRAIEDADSDDQARQQLAEQTTRALAVAAKAGGLDGDYIDATGFLAIFEHMLGIAALEQAHADTHPPEGPNGAT